MLRRSATAAAAAADRETDEQVVTIVHPDIELVPTDTDDTCYYKLTESRAIRAFVRGFKGNNKNAVHPYAATQLAKADFIMFALLRTCKTSIDGPETAGRHALSMMAKDGQTLILNTTVSAHRRDNFATELINVYKTAIGSPLVVDAPPCRAPVPLTCATRLCHTPLCHSPVVSRCGPQSRSRPSPSTSRRNSTPPRT
jgi:hypothetical protein